MINTGCGCWGNHAKEKQSGMCQSCQARGRTFLQCSPVPSPAPNTACIYHTLSFSPQEGQTGVTSLIASTVFSFVDRESCLEETDPVIFFLKSATYNQYETRAKLSIWVLPWRNWPGNAIQSIGNILLKFIQRDPSTNYCRSDNLEQEQDQNYTECISGFDPVQDQSTDPRPERSASRITLCFLSWQPDATLTWFTWATL